MTPKMQLLGTGFASREGILITVAGQGVVKVHSTTTSAGTFRVAVKAPPAAACGQYFLRAHGLTSQRTATLRLGFSDCANPSPNPGPSPS